MNCRKGKVDRERAQRRVMFNQVQGLNWPGEVVLLLMVEALRVTVTGGKG